MVGEETVNLPAIVYLLLCGFCWESFPLSVGVWEGCVISL